MTFACSYRIRRRERYRYDTIDCGHDTGRGDGRVVKETR